MAARAIFGLSVEPPEPPLNDLPATLAPEEARMQSTAGTAGRLGGHRPVTQLAVLQARLGALAARRVRTRVARSEYADGDHAF